MKAYGLPRYNGVGAPDKYDIAFFARKSKLCKQAKSGDHKNSLRSSKQKRAIRRVFKRIARRYNFLIPSNSMELD
jgi:hypothetical protein